MVLILILCLGGLFWITGCNPRGIPASYLLTPAGLQSSSTEQVPSTTLTPFPAEPSLNSTERLAEKSPTASRTAPPRFTATATLTPTPAKSIHKNPLPHQDLPAHANPPTKQDANDHPHPHPTLGFYPYRAPGTAFQGWLADQCGDGYDPW